MREQAGDPVHLIRPTISCMEVGDTAFSALQPRSSSTDRSCHNLGSLKIQNGSGSPLRVLALVLPIDQATTNRNKSMRIFWQSFIDETSSKEYLERLNSYLNEIARFGTTVEVFGMSPPRQGVWSAIRVSLPLLLGRAAASQRKRLAMTLSLWVIFRSRPL